MKYFVLIASLTLASSCFALEKLPAGHPPVDSSNTNAPAAASQLPQQGKVLEVISVPQYTYVQVSQDKETIWLAGPSVEVKKGDTVHFDNGMVMKDFHSNSLDRTFPSILFVNRIAVGG